MMIWGLFTVGGNGDALALAGELVGLGWPSPQPHGFQFHGRRV